MLLFDEQDVNKMFASKVDCFGAAVAGGISAGIVAANLAAVGLVVSTIGIIQQGKQAAGQAKFQAGVASNNAIVAQQQADRAAQQGRIDEGDFRRQQSDLFATRRSLFGGTNVDDTKGSPLAVSKDFAGESELNALRVRNQGQVNVNTRDQQSQASLFGQKARSAATNSAFRAGGQLFSGAGTIASGFVKK
jgi:hypothetical protein